MGNCNTLNDLSKKVYVTNKTEDVSLNLIDMITEINCKRFSDYI